MNSNDIFVAKLGKAVGLQGHLRLFIDSDFPEQFKKVLYSELIKIRTESS